jgi:UDP-galactopyranose mutase
MGVSAYDVLVVGAGFAGAVMAERIAAVRGLRVLVIDRREHIAGNAYDVRDAHGVPINRSTLNALYGLSLRDEAAVQAFFAARAEPRSRVETSEDAVVAKVGPGALRDAVPRLHAQAVGP